MARAADIAYEAIRGQITAGKHAAGTRLREADLADEVGVSRTPIREALRKLHAEGLVEFVPNRGAHVASWTDQDLTEVFDLRAVLEGYAARLAAKRIGDSELAELSHLADQMDDAANGRGRSRLDKIAQLNNQFHQVIIEASGNRHLVAIITGLVELPLVHRTFRRYGPDDLARSMDHHRELIHALNARDVNWAGTVMRSHIYAARTVLTQTGSAT